MPHLCPKCERPNAPHRTLCLYCGADLPEPTEAPPTRPERSLPSNIDHLVKQAMTLGMTHKLQEAMLSHQDQEQNDPGTELESVEEIKTNPREILERLRGAANSALAAFDAQNETDLVDALLRVKTALGAWGPLKPRDTADDEQGPVIHLPKVRRKFGLVVEGIGDVDKHELVAAALNMDAATARMIAIARQPRTVLRGDEREKLSQMAVRLREDAGLEATVVDEERLRAMGPAWLLHGFASGPTLVPVTDWTQTFDTPAVSTGSRPMLDAPLLVVPGEVVILKYRSSRSTGRLKHLRDGRMQTASEQRLALADLHTASGIVRIVEGHTNLSEAPGAVEDGFRRSLRALIDNWSEQGIRVLEPRTCAPSGQKGQSPQGLDQSAYSTGWSDWEEHSRAAGALFIGDASVYAAQPGSPDSPPVDPEPTNAD